MKTIYLVNGYEDNPKRKRRKKSRSHPPSAAQLRARKKFSQMVRAKARQKKARKTLIRKSIKHRPVFYGSKEKIGLRSPYKRLNPQRREVMTRTKKHRRRYHRNPGLGGIIGKAKGGIVSAFNDALPIAVGIMGTNLIVNQVVPKTMTGMTRSLVKLGIPMAVGAFIKSPFVKKAAAAGTAFALVEAVKGFLPAGISAQLSGYDFPNIPQRSLPDLKYQEDYNLLGEGGLPTP